MSGQNGGVSLYRVYRSDTPIHLGQGDTPGDTGADTPSLKSLAGKYLSEEKPIQQAIQSPIQQGEKRIALISGADTPERILFCHGKDKKTERKIDSSINESTPAQLAHARTLLVDCPATGEKRHCWHCSRCEDARTCTAWRTRRQDVEFFRQSEKPYSLTLMEEYDAAAFSEWLDRVAPGPVPDYAAFCPEYWPGCFACPDFLAEKLRFCSRYNRLNGEAAEVAQ